jgi:hypothetical protein
VTFLKKLTNKNHSVKELLLKSVGGSESARSPKELHASDLTRQDPTFCPREVALHRVENVPRKDQWVQHAMRVTWDEGRDKQWRVNNDYLRPYMVGPWHCTRCGDDVEWGGLPSADGCKSPRGQHAWEYEEPVFHHPSGFSGSLDGLVRFSSAVIRPLEVKIIKGDDFKTLKAPLAEHRVRTQLYLRLVAESTHPRTAEISTDCAHVLYIMRGHGAKDEEGTITPFKEFVVKRDDTVVDKYVWMSESIKAGMPEGTCASMMDPRAKKCLVAKHCFSGKHPPTSFWRKGT